MTEQTMKDELKARETMAVTLTEWLYELFCESRSVDMNDIQEKMVDIGIIEGSKADEDDIESGFEGEIGDIVFHKTAEYKAQKDNTRAAEPVSDDALTEAAGFCKDVCEQAKKMGQAAGEDYDGSCFLRHIETLINHALKGGKVVECDTISVELSTDKYERRSPIVIGLKRIPARNLFNISVIEAKSLVQKLTKIIHGGE